MLYHCDSTGAKTTRAALGSHWDHAGMIIRVDADEKEDEILVMEATTNSGVHLKNFSKMTVHLGGFYQKLALRHLDFKRTDE